MNHPVQRTSPPGLPSPGRGERYLQRMNTCNTSPAPLAGEWAVGERRTYVMISRTSAPPLPSCERGPGGEGSPLLSRERELGGEGVFKGVSQ